MSEEWDLHLCHECSQRRTHKQKQNRPLKPSLLCLSVFVVKQSTEVFYKIELKCTLSLATRHEKQPCFTKARLYSMCWVPSPEIYPDKHLALSLFTVTCFCCCPVTPLAHFASCRNASSTVWLTSIIKSEYFYLPPQY